MNNYYWSLYSRDEIQRRYPAHLFQALCLAVIYSTLASVSAAGASAASASEGIRPQRVGDAIAEFHFLRSDCAQGNFYDHSKYDLLGGLVRDPAHSTCLRGNGITSLPRSASGGFPLRSARSIRDLVGSVQRSELSVEMWLRTTSAIADETSIISFAHPSSLSDFAFRIDQSGVTSATPNGLRMKTRNSAGSIIVADAQTAPIHRYFHVVFDVKYVVENYFNKKFYGLHENVTMNATLLQQYFDMSTSGSFDTALWNPSYALHLFTSLPSGAIGTGAGPVENYWPGEILLLAIYNHTLSLADVRKNFKAGLPNSQPVVWSVKTRVFEDGQSPSDRNVYYSLDTIAAEDLGVMELPCFDVDDTRGHPNFALNNGSFASYATCYITSLPSSGILYALRPHSRQQPASAGSTSMLNESEVTSGDWEAVVSVPWPVFIGAIAAADIREPLYAYGNATAPGLVKGYFVKYRPARNQFSLADAVYDRFVVRASDEASGITSDAGTIEIIVDSVNDPPDAAKGLSSDVYANVSAVLLLGGSDVDGTAVSAIVMRLPGLGSLFDVHKNGTVSKQPIKIAPFTLSSINVAYRYLGSQSSSIDDVINTDDFEFAVTDNLQVMSASQIYRLIVRSAIVVVNNASTTTGFEASVISIPLSARDLSLSNRLLFAQIQSPPKHGLLIDPFTRLPLDVSNWRSDPMSSWQGLATINMSYVGNAYFFSLPRTRVNGSEIPTAEKDTFTVVYRSEDGAVSKPATIFISAINRNHPTNVSFTYGDPWSDQGMFDIYTISADNGSGNHVTRAVINGFSFVDPDRDSNVVRLRITTSGGRVSLNENYLKGIIFNGIAYCYQSEWRCRGDGVDDVEISAVGSPHDVFKAIEGMTFRSALQDYVDTVNVTIFDGVGGQCVSPKAVDQYTQQMGCFESTVSFKVNVKAVEEGYYSDGSSVLFGNFISMELIVIILIGVILTLCCYNIYSCYKKRVNKFIDSNPLDAVLAQQQLHQQHYCASCNARSDAVVLVEEHEAERAVRVGIVLGDSGSDTNSNTDSDNCLSCVQGRAAEVP